MTLPGVQQLKVVATRREPVRVDAHVVPYRQQSYATLLADELGARPSAAMDALRQESLAARPTAGALSWVALRGSE